MSPIRHLRWWIGGLLFLSTVINYIDRQTLSVLAPFIKEEFHASNSDFALVIVAFRVAYAIGQSVNGRLLDKLGTRRGLGLSVAFYSLAGVATSFSTGLRSLAFFRFLLGAGESANWPGATKAVSEWFPKQEAGWAVAIFDSGSAVGGAVAPLIVLWAFHTFGDWHPAFAVTGVLGFLWLILFRKLYYRPEEHPRLSAAEREYILSNRASLIAGESTISIPYRKLLSLRHTWGIVLGKSLTDPIWFFITDWIAIYLVSKGFRVEESLLAFWAPFLAADLGNFAGGGASSVLIRRGMPVLRSRRLVLLVTGIGMSLLIPMAFFDSFPLLVGLLSASTFCYAAFSTIILTLPADLYPTHSVASVSGLSGTGAGIGTIAATLLTGVVSDKYSFAPVLIAAGLIPLAATVAVLALVRPAKQGTS